MIFNIHFISIFDHENISLLFYRDFYHKLIKTVILFITISNICSNPDFLQRTAPKNQLLRIGQWTNAVSEAVCIGPQETWDPPWPPDLYFSRNPSTIHTCRAWSACRPTPVHAGPPIAPARAVAHQKFAPTGALHGPYCTKAHDQRMSKHWEGSISRPNPLSCQPPVHFPPRHFKMFSAIDGERWC